MKIVLLAATQAEARKQAADAGLKPHSRDIICPGSIELLYGITLHEEDLVMEFPGFRDRPDAKVILQMVKHCIAKSPDAGPVWRTAGEPSRV